LLGKISLNVLSEMEQMPSPKHVGPEAEGSNPTTLRIILYICHKIIEVETSVIILLLLKSNVWKELLLVSDFRYQRKFTRITQLKSTKKQGWNISSFERNYRMFVTFISSCVNKWVIIF
jgi:hypothetical protein